MLMRPKLTLNWQGKTQPVPDLIFVDVTKPTVMPAPPVRHRIVVEPFDPLSPLQICLGHWASWMGQNDSDLDSKNQRGIVSGTDDDAPETAEEASIRSANAAQASADRDSREIAMATNAMIFSMPAHFRAAIFRRCNIATVWHFPNMDFTVTLPQAEECLKEKLSKNIATRAFF